MTDMKKTISPEVELQAFALFVMAKHHALEATKYERRMNEMLGVDMAMGGGNLSDQIYSRDETADKADFDKAARKDGVQVKQEAA